MVSQRIPSTFLPVEDQGYFFVVIQLPDGASLQRTDAVAEKVRGHPGRHPRRRHRRLDQRPQLPDQRGPVELGGRVRDPEAMGRATRPDQSASTDRRRRAHEAAQIPEAIALSFDPPSIPGLGTTGGFEFQVEDLTGRGSVALNEATQALIAEARKQPELNAQQLFSSFSTSTPQFNYDLDRNKAKLLGLNLPDVFNTLQIYLGSLYVNDFNLFGRTFRVTLQADKDARAAAADLSRLYVRNATGGMVPLSTLGTLKPDRRPGDRAALQQLRFGADQRRRGAGLQFRARRSRRWSAPPRRRCRAISPIEWTGITYPGAQGGIDRHGRVRAGDRLRLPDPGRAIRELGDAVHGAARGAAGAVRRAAGAVGARHADRRLFADRLRHADRPCGEERDSDRRVRQAPARGGARASSTPRWKPRGCGCGRS